jgi:hypothetical protein
MGGSSFSRSFSATAIRYRWTWEMTRRFARSKNARQYAGQFFFPRFRKLFPTPINLTAASCFMLEPDSIGGLVSGDIRKLADQLAQCSQLGGGAHLAPQSVDVALAALRAYGDMLGPPKIKRTRQMFQIEAMDSRGWPEEVLALVKDALIVRAAFEEAVRRHPDR